MEKITVYLKCERNVEVCQDTVYIYDIGSVYCHDICVREGIMKIPVYHFDKINSPRRHVINVLKVIALIQEQYPDIHIEILGETDILIERTNTSRNKKTVQMFKIVLVSLVSFCGTAFAIMAYHVDVGINKVFSEIYGLVMNVEPDGLNPMSVSYSVGVAAGIILFFNHVGGRKITNDPTPIEVAMRKYEEDVDETLIEEAGRASAVSTQKEENVT
jgi:stage V sporulation protein AA